MPFSRRWTRSWPRRLRATHSGSRNAMSESLQRGRLSASRRSVGRLILRGPIGYIPTVSPAGASAYFRCVCARIRVLLRLDMPSTCLRTCSAPRRFQIMNPGSRTVMLDYLQGRMYRYLVVSLEQIDRVVFADFVKMNNVPEVPTDDGFALCQRCNGYVQRIRQRSS